MPEEGDLLWTPTREWRDRTNLSGYMKWLESEHGLSFAGYSQLWEWSVGQLERFWESNWQYFDISSPTPYDCVLADPVMPGALWFPGASVNYAEHVLRKARPGATALYSLSELKPLTEVSWEQLRDNVVILATKLRELGIEPGDRVVAYMPNIPQAVIAMLATTAIGGIWSSCSPDFGTRSVLDRFRQVAPKLIFCVDGYRYRGREFDRREEVRAIVRHLPSVEHVVYCPHLRSDATVNLLKNGIRWDELFEPLPERIEDFRFESVAFDHPLWILFSSGTTGLPKPIVHSHGGMTLELLKLLSFHLDLKPNDRMFFFTTTGWMMWNLVSGALITGAAGVLYDGDPAYPDPDVLWKMAESAGATVFGASPTYVRALARAGIVPREKYDLSSLRTIVMSGSPATPESMRWFYDNVKADLWVSSASGGTDICSGFVGGVPTLPVYAGEIQGRLLGADVCAYTERGVAVVGEVGELVVRQPMPSMPLYFWNDIDGSRYRESYFEEFPGVWRHGDFIKINKRGGCFICGRSDSTLNRYGVRIGTAEIYRTVESLEEIEDSLVVSLDLPRGEYFMPLFVKLRSAFTLTNELIAKIRATLRSECSPRHVPDEIFQVQAIPITLTGKKMEVPVRGLLMGTPMKDAADPDAMTNPESLEYFAEFRRQHMQPNPNV